MALNVGSRLGSYEVTALIGSGGMGEVYRAKDTKLGTEVGSKGEGRQGDALWTLANSLSETAPPGCIVA